MSTSTMRVPTSFRLKEEKTISPELQAKLDKARTEILSGQCIELNSHEDIDKYFVSL